MTSAKDKLEKFLSEKGVSKKQTCAQCNNWRVDKSDKIQREHAAQGRALCQEDSRMDKPFLHHSHAACAKINYVDLDLEIKRLEYLKGK